MSKIHFHQVCTKGGVKFSLKVEEVFKQSLQSRAAVGYKCCNVCVAGLQTTFFSQESQITLIYTSRDLLSDKYFLILCSIPLNLALRLHLTGKCLKKKTFNVKESESNSKAMHHLSGLVTHLN